jgi:rod shape-determining protein MreD
MKIRDWLRARRLIRVSVASESAAGASGSVRGRPQSQVLRPVSPVFIWVSILAALAINLLPWGRAWLIPDFLALALVFWNIHQPRRVGMAAAFLFGLLMDVHDGALFGEHALAYTLLSYGAISLHRRILWFPVPSQSLYVLPLLLVAQLASAFVRLWASGHAPDWWSYPVQSAMGAVLWPLASWLLLLPQKRAISRDETRPI